MNENEAMGVCQNYYHQILHQMTEIQIFQQNTANNNMI